MKHKHKFDFKFWPMKVELIPWLHYFAIWIFIVGFGGGSKGWMLFGVTVNEFRGYAAEKVALTITFLGHNFRFGVKSQLNQINRSSNG